MSYEQSFQKEDLDAYKIGGATPASYDIIKPFLIGKGGGSAYGGPWKPSKPADKRFLGEPGETKDSPVPTSRGEYRVITIIGPD